jgi:metallo-beta-lactamase class B
MMMRQLFLCTLLCFASGGLFQVHLKAQQGIRITPLTQNFFVFTTWGNHGGSPFPANGLYVVTGSGIIMIDTPWDTTQTLPLLDSIRARHHQPVVLCIPTHYHNDRTGGVDQLRRLGIGTWSSAQTQRLARQKGEPVPEHTFLSDTIMRVGSVTLQTFYPGPGHTPDNIVVWFPDARVLYGGCFIKSTEAGTLGNLEDADLAAWPASLRKVQENFTKPRFIIPGHQSWESRGSLKHTVKLLDSHAKKKQ